MRYNMRNNVHLEGWAATDIKFHDNGRDSASLLLAIATDTQNEDGKSEKGRELLKIELRTTEMRFIPIIRKGTHLIIDGALKVRAEQGQQPILAVIAIRIQSIDWEGYKTEGLRAMTEGTSEEQGQLAQKWGASALENRR